MKLNGEEEITTPYHGRWMVGACSDEAPKGLGIFTTCTCNMHTNNKQPLYIYPYK